MTSVSLQLLGVSRMHVHLPKPLHGWREFAGEVGIIVLGVLIALGAEQAIESIHDRAVTSQSRRDVREEVATNLGFYGQRLQESPCIESKLDDLSKMVDLGTVHKDKVRWIGRPADLVAFTERWRAVTSSARTALFPPVEQSRLDAVYGIFGALAEESHNEERAWNDLGIMNRLDGPLDAETRLMLRRALEQARRTDDVIQTASYYALFHAHALKINANPETAPRRGDVHSICLPLSTDPEQAQRLLGLRVPQ